MKFLCVYFLSIFNLFTQESSSIENYQQLIDQGAICAQEHNYTSAIAYYTEAEWIADENQWREKQCIVKNNIGNIYSDISNYGEALSYYQQALKIAETYSFLKPKQGVMLNNIGLLYNKKENIEKAIAYYQKGYQLKVNDAYARTLLGINLAAAYHKKKELHRARQYLEEIRELDKSKRLAQAWTINLAENYFLNDSLKKAQELLEPLLRPQAGAPDPDCFVCISELLTNIYFQQQNYDQSEFYAHQGLVATKQKEKKQVFFDLLAKVSREKKELKKAIAYKDSAIAIKDQITKHANMQLFETNRVKMDMQEIKNKISFQKEQQFQVRLLFGVIGLFILILAFFIYKSSQQKWIKNRQAHALALTKQELSKLELKKEKDEQLLLEEELNALANHSSLTLEKLKQKVNQKNEKLSAKAIALSARNRLIEEVISNLTKGSQNEHREINQHIRSLKNHLKTDTRWYEFTRHFEEVNPGFMKAVQDRYANLSTKDIRFLCYVYMGLSLEEIAALFHITIEACRKRKQRLCNKMEIPIEDLYQLVLNIS
ncbi:tetratricopeptide repeat protein [Mesonia aquimarina]|uniref:tetratricopeptide repeat protein n=1 Tax=Mesonia aquimarina TaxID=1504967 RepID=UPI000EF5F92C|nr:tetratricopeptide repeat protein [Mesonia aquimarina]